MKARINNTDEFDIGIKPATPSTRTISLPLSVLSKIAPLGPVLIY